MATAPLRHPGLAIIVDSGLRSYGGHNYLYTRAVQNALEQQGIAVRVLVNRGFPGDQARVDGFTPTFSVGAHDYALGQGFLADLAYVHAQSIVFAHELQAALRGCQDKPWLVFSHTVGDFELIGWSCYLRRNKLPGHLMLLLRVTPGFRTMSSARRYLHPYVLKPRYLRAIWRRLGRYFTLLTDSSALSADYASVHPGRIATLPIPVAPNLGSSSQSADAQLTGTSQASKREVLLRVGYVGDARESKGFHLLPVALLDLIPKTKSYVHFVIQTSWASVGRGASDIPSGVLELQQLAGRNPDRITLVPERLHPEDYRKLINEIDIVLLPYVTDLYREATSGIFAEALALGKVVVVSTGTWMAHELSRSGGGETCRRGDALDLAVKTLAAIDRYHDHAMRAKAFQVEWSSFHNPHTLVRILLQEANGRFPPEYPNAPELATQ